MLRNLFDGVKQEELRKLYSAILLADKAGMRPKELDVYIEQIREQAPTMDVADAWKMAEGFFYEEVAKRYFAEYDFWNEPVKEDDPGMYKVGINFAVPEELTEEQEKKILYFLDDMFNTKLELTVEKET